MRIIKTLIKKELIFYLTSNLSFLSMTVFTLCSALSVLQTKEIFFLNQTAALFAYMPYTFILLLPALSIHIWPEERKDKTLSFLLSFPIHEYEILLSKFIAAWLYMIAMIVTTLPLIIILTQYQEIDMGVVYSGYVGTVLLATMMLALVCCLSSLSKRAAVVYLTTFSTLLLLYHSAENVITSLFPSDYHTLLQSLSIKTQYQNLMNGSISLDAISYFLSLTLFFLIVNLEIIKIKRD
ncbi:MAG: ABC transporter permease subunit [bacterium]